MRPQWLVNHRKNGRQFRTAAISSNSAKNAENVENPCCFAFYNIEIEFLVIDLQYFECKLSQKKRNWIMHRLKILRNGIELGLGVGDLRKNMKQKCSLYLSLNFRWKKLKNTFSYVRTRHPSLTYNYNSPNTNLWLIST